jgi:hypothetical protein
MSVEYRYIHDINIQIQGFELTVLGNTTDDIGMTLVIKRSDHSKNSLRLMTKVILTVSKNRRTLRVILVHTSKDNINLTPTCKVINM